MIVGWQFGRQTSSRSGTVGRNRATLLTVKPDRLKQIIASASVSVAVRAAAIVRASVTLVAASDLDLRRIARYVRPNSRNQTSRPLAQ